MSVLKPGMALLNTLPFARKFQLILSIFLLPLLYSLWVMYTDESMLITANNRQLAGNRLVQAIHPIRITAAKHRGTAAQWFGGKTEVAERLVELESDMQRQQQSVQKALAGAKIDDSLKQQFSSVFSRWSSLEFSKLKSMDGSDSFKAHTQWITSITDLVDDLASGTGLLLDRNLDSFMVMQLAVFDVPAVQETLGQLRGKGAGVAASGAFNPQSFLAVNGLFAGINLVWKKVEQHHAVLTGANANVAGLLESDYSSAKEAVIRFKKITELQLIKPDRPQITAKAYFDAGTAAIAAVAKYYEALQAQYVLLNRDYKDQIENHLFGVITIFVLLCALGIYLFAALKSSVDYNVHVTQAMAKNLERGNLSEDFSSHSQDELGLTVNSLNAAFQQMRKVVQRVRDNSNTLTQSSGELQSVAKDVNELGESQKHRVEVIVTAATELAATAKEVANHCEGASQETQSTKTQAREGAVRSQSSAEVIRELAASIRSAGEEISHLAQKAASISTVIDVIKAIAEQTNLLALNAAIEAARAGEQGRGFAVVADEVRTLATRTQESTNEIESTITSLQSVAEQAVSAMETACSQADSGEKQAIETGKMLQDIEQGVIRVSDLIQQVATAGEQQAEAAEEIARHIQEVDDASSNLVERANRVSHVSGDVGSGSLSLDETVKKFQV